MVHMATSSKTTASKKQGDDSKNHPKASKEDAARKKATEAQVRKVTRERAKLAAKAAAKALAATKSAEKPKKEKNASPSDSSKATSKKPAAKPAEKPAAKPAVKAEKAPEAKKTEPKPAPKAEKKPEPKKPEAKPAPKATKKPEAKAPAKADSKAEPKKQEPKKTESKKTPPKSSGKTSGKPEEKAADKKKPESKPKNTKPTKPVAEPEIEEEPIVEATKVSMSAMDSEKASEFGSDDLDSMDSATSMRSFGTDDDPEIPLLSDDFSAEGEMHEFASLSDLSIGDDLVGSREETIDDNAFSDSLSPLSNLAGMDDDSVDLFGGGDDDFDDMAPMAGDDDVYTPDGSIDPNAATRTLGVGIHDGSIDGMPAVSSELDQAAARERREERNEKINELVNLCNKQGYITTEDLHEILPESIIKDTDLESYLSVLKSLDIPVIDMADVEKFQNNAVNADRGRIDIDDPIRMYLLQMGEFPLLERKDEFEICQTIEESEKKVRTLFNRFGFSPRMFSEMLKRIELGSERFDRVVTDKLVDSREQYMIRIPEMYKALDDIRDRMTAAYEKQQTAKGKDANARVRKEIETIRQDFRKITEESEDGERASGGPMIPTAPQGPVSLEKEPLCLHFKQKTIESIALEARTRIYDVYCANQATLTRLKSKSRLSQKDIVERDEAIRANKEMEAE